MTNILNNINFKYEVADEQKNLFTPHHTLFKCVIKYNNKSYTFNYQCNTTYTEPKLLDVMDALILDADSYENYDESEFFYEFGYYDNMKEGKRIYNACKRTANALKRVFGDDLEALYSEVSNAINA